MSQTEEPSLVEIWENVRLPIPEKEFAFASYVFEMLIEKISKVHEFFCKSREEEP